jgi:hypothetical protein
MGRRQNLEEWILVERVYEVDPTVRREDVGDFAVTYSDLLSHDFDDLVWLSVDLIDQLPGVDQVLHDDREIISVWGPSVDLQATVTVVREWWDDQLNRLGRIFADRFVGTEQLGRPRFGIVLGQRRLCYPTEPERPFGTCHLQAHSYETALCGYPDEGLTAIPGSPPWLTVSDDLKCARCERRRALMDSPTERITPG